MMLIFFLISFQILYCVAETQKDEIFSQSNQNLSQHVWHSYTFNTGAGNREELQFTDVKLNEEFVEAHGIFKWKNLEVEGKIVIIGLAPEYLLCTIYSAENNSNSFQAELSDDPIDFTIFQKWDAKTQTMKSFVVVAVQTKSGIHELKWYELVHWEVKHLWDWQFHKVITHINFIRLNNELKLLIVGANNFRTNYSADLYNFKITSHLDIWLFERIVLDDEPSSISFFDDNDNLFLSVSFPLLQMVQIFRYPKAKICLEASDQKRFVLHEKIFSKGVKSLVSFRVGFRWYLAVAGSGSLIYEIKEDISFHPVRNLNLGDQNYWLVIPVGTYREDVMIVCGSGNNISVIAWAGNEELKVMGNFSRLLCRDDVSCLDKLNGISLERSTAFYFRGSQNIVFSTKRGSPLLFKLSVKLKQLSDAVVLKLNEIIRLKNNFQEKYENQARNIQKLYKINENISSNSDKNEPNENLIRQKKFTTSNQPILKKENDDLKSFSQIINQTELLNSVERLKKNISSLKYDVSNVIAAIKSNVSFDSPGITFYGEVLIDELNLYTINGYNVDELLRDSVRKNEMKEIGGTKTFKNLNPHKLVFDKIGNIVAGDIMFADDPWDQENGNIINGDIIFENELSVSSNIYITNASTSDSDEFVPEIRNHSFENLYFEELEITNETFVKKSINSLPLILPVHGPSLNVHCLDAVNRSRIEHINGKNNLEVDCVNGKVLTDILNQIALRKDTQTLNCDTLKVDGIFFTDALEAENIHSFDPPERTASEKDEDKVLPNPSVVEDSLSSIQVEGEAQNNKVKRIIHVFQNLEVEGNVLTDGINRHGWDFFNDTIRKNQENVILSGSKFFENMTARNITIYGKLNDERIENVLTNDTDQNWLFYSEIETAEFLNVTLNKTWNNICVECLNRNLIRLSSDEEYDTHIEFKDSGTLNINLLNVTESVNGVPLESKLTKNNTTVKNDFIFNEIRASKVILNGSLFTNSKINNINLTEIRQRLEKFIRSQTEESIRYVNMTITGDLNITSINNKEISSENNSDDETKFIENFINGKINRLKKLLVKGNVSTTDGVNGFNLSRLVEHGVSITKPNVLNGTIIFENTVHFNNINVVGTIDGFSLENLEKDIIFNEKKIFLRGPKNFSTVKVTKNASIASLNGHLITDVVTLRGDHVMKGPVKINGDVVIRGNIFSLKAINEFFVKDVLKKYTTKYNSYVHLNDLELAPEKVQIDKLVIGRNVQNFSFNGIVNDAILKNGSFIATGKKIFQGKVHFKGNVIVENLINGLNFSKFYKDIIFINKPDRIGGVLTMGEVRLKDLAVENYFNATLINEIDLNSWIEDSVNLDKYEWVYGKKKFENAHVLKDVEVDFINGHSSFTMISLKGNQIIPSISVFPRLNVSDLSVYGYVNNKNLKDLYDDSVLTNGSQTINGMIKFNKKFTVEGNLTVKLINNKTVNELITLDTNQTVKSPLIFDGVVSLNEDVNRLKFVNNINLQKWNTTSVLLNREQVINGTWTVKGNVTVKNIEGVGLLNSVSLPKLSASINRNRVVAHEIKHETEMEFNDQCRRVKKLSKIFPQMPYLFQQFVVGSEIETPFHIESTIPFKINKDFYLIVTYVNKCLSDLHKWNSNNAKYTHLRQIYIGPVHKWLVAYQSNTTYLITSSRKKDIKCEENHKEANIWVLEEDKNKYEHLSTSNAFVDIIQENEFSKEFFTLEENGFIYKWTLKENKTVSSEFLFDVGTDNYSFVDFKVTGSLTVSNQQHVKEIMLFYNITSEKVLSIPEGHLVSLPLENKTLTALIVKDKVVVYDNIFDGKIFSMIQTSTTGSVLWLNFGLHKQAFLIIPSYHKLIEVYEYKSVSGFVKKLSFQMHSTRLLLLALPSKEKYQESRYLTVVQKKKIILLEANMSGDYFEENEENSLC